MISQSDIETQEQLLLIHRRNLALYLQQKAIHGYANVPPNIMHGIRESRVEIQKAKKTLEKWNIPITEHPYDEENSKETEVNQYNPDIENETQTKSISLPFYEAEKLQYKGERFAIITDNRGSTLAIKTSSLFINQNQSEFETAQGILYCEDMTIDHNIIRNIKFNHYIWHRFTETIGIEVTVLDGKVIKTRMKLNHYSSNQIVMGKSNYITVNINIRKVMRIDFFQ